MSTAEKQDFSQEFRHSESQIAFIHNQLPIMCVGNVPALLELRANVIRSTGLLVQSFSPEQAEEIVRSSEHRVWIFCNTLEIGPLIFLASTEYIVNFLSEFAFDCTVAGR